MLQVGLLWIWDPREDPQGCKGPYLLLLLVCNDADILICVDVHSCAHPMQHLMEGRGGLVLCGHLCILTVCWWDPGCVPSAVGWGSCVSPALYVVTFIPVSVCLHS